jgi:hypothetical protein
MKTHHTVLLILTAILAGAHFLRDGNLLLTAICLLFPLILRVKKPWVWWTIQFFALGSALLWVNVALEIANIRIIVGEPWGRMAAILSSVAIFSIITAALFWPKSVRMVFGFVVQEQ